MKVETELTPVAVIDGEPVTCTARGLEAHAGKPVNLVLGGIDDVQTMWIASIGATVGEDGTARGEVELSLGRETAVHVTAIKVVGLTPGAGEIELRAPDQIVPGRCLANSTLDVADTAGVAARTEELRVAQDARYSEPLGDPGAPDAKEHRVLCVVERLLMTTRMRLPGVEVLPVDAGSTGKGELELLYGVLEALGWPSRLPDGWWEERSQRNRPWTGLLMPSVWAHDVDAASRVAWDQRDLLLDVLALNRGTSPRPIATVVEQRRDNEVGPFRIYQEDEHYTGNLIGGAVSGEDQLGLLIQDAAVRSDPLLALCLSLFRDALAERSPDAQYFRLWSVLETLSGARIPPGAKVGLLDGSAWGGRAGTTSYAAPRVYELLARAIRQRSISESSFAGPAADLSDAVRGWYARRNATAHYGGLVLGDPRQAGQHWYKRAIATVPAAGDHTDQWLWNLRHAVESVLQGELMAVGRPLLLT